jgi:hypothetical protein
VVSIPEGKQDELAKAYEQALKDRKLMPKEGTERQRMELAYITMKLNEYVGEKKKLDENGQKFIGDRKTAHRQDGYFDYAELLLQLAIVLASISMLSKARWPYFISLALAIVGLTIAIGGFVIPKHAPTVHIPLIDPKHDDAGH